MKKLTPKKRYKIVVIVVLGIGLTSLLVNCFEEKKIVEKKMVSVTTLVYVSNDNDTTSVVIQGTTYRLSGKIAYWYKIKDGILCFNEFHKQRWTCLTIDQIKMFWKENPRMEREKNDQSVY